MNNTSSIQEGNNVPIDRSVTSIKDEQYSIIIDNHLKEFNDLIQKFDEIKQLLISRQSILHNTETWKNKIEKHVSNAKSTINEFISLLNIPEFIKDSAFLMYKNMIYQTPIKDEEFKLLIVASIFTACKYHGLSIPLKTISEKLSVDHKSLFKYHRIIITKLQINLPSTPYDNYAQIYIAKLGLSPQTLRRTLLILDKAKKSSIVNGRDPVGIVTASIYIATKIEGEKRSQKEIADSAKITEVTVRNRYKELLSILDEDLKNILRNKT